MDDINIDWTATAPEPVSISPTPVGPGTDEIPALMQPASRCPENVYVGFKEANQVNYDGDWIIFELVFNVSLDGKSVPVRKMIKVNKADMCDDANAVLGQKVQVVENKKPAAKSTTQRYRELAGIPHKSNFT